MEQDPAKLPAHMSTEDKQLHQRLVAIMNKAGVGQVDIIKEHLPEMSRQKLSDALRRRYGPSDDVFDAVVTLCAPLLGQTPAQLDAELRPFLERARKPLDQPATTVVSARPVPLEDITRSAERILGLLLAADDDVAAEEFLALAEPAPERVHELLRLIGARNPSAVAGLLGAIAEHDQSDARVRDLLSHLEQIDQATAAAVRAVPCPPRTAPETEPEPGVLSLDPETSWALRMVGLASRGRTDQAVREIFAADPPDSEPDDPLSFLDRLRAREEASPRSRRLATSFAAICNCEPDGIEAASELMAHAHDTEHFGDVASAFRHFLKPSVTSETAESVNSLIGHLPDVVVGALVLEFDDRPVIGSDDLAADVLLRRLLPARFARITASPEASEDTEQLIITAARALSAHPQAAAAFTETYSALHMREESCFTLVLESLCAGGPATTAAARHLAQQDPTEIISVIRGMEGRRDSAPAALRHLFGELDIVKIIFSLTDPTFVQTTTIPDVILEAVADSVLPTLMDADIEAVCRLIARAFDAWDRGANVAEAHVGSNRLAQVLLSDSIYRARPARVHDLLRRLLAAHPGDAAALLSIAEANDQIRDNALSALSELIIGASHTSEDPGSAVVSNVARLSQTEIGLPVQLLEQLYHRTPAGRRGSRVDGFHRR